MLMRIVLAGHNIDIELLRHLKTQILEPVASGWEESRLDGMSEAELRAQAAELQRRAAAPPRPLRPQPPGPGAWGWEESRLDGMSEAELRAQAAELQRRTAEFLGRWS